MVTIKQQSETERRGKSFFMRVIKNLSFWELFSLLIFYSYSSNFKFRNLKSLAETITMINPAVNN